MSIVLALALLQVGPFTPPGTMSDSPLPHEIPARRSPAEAPAAPAAESRMDPDFRIAADIAATRAVELVSLGQLEEAETALAEARELTPGDAQVWLLSATLSRRLGQLAEAQARIEKAAELLPTDPEIGLEAGVIAVLAGRDEAARKSWESVIAAAPGSPAAATAKDYLAQLSGSAQP